jgi:hypothetical protein
MTRGLVLRQERESWRVAGAVIGAVALWIAGALSLPGGGSAQGAVRAPNSADSLIVWTACPHLLELTDVQLDLWKSRGVDGFACMHGKLRDMGGSQDFTGNPGASLAGSNYAVQRSLRNTNIVGRMRARGMKAYLGLKLANFHNPATPLRDWFDDRGWSDHVVPKMADAAAAARQLGFAGLAIDQELYPQRGGVTTATWDWDYPGNSHSEPQVRAKATQRGRELMAALTRSFPGIELLAYHVQLPETWRELVQEKVNGIERAMDPLLDIDFWDGLSSVQGYGAIRLVDSTFYKTPHVGSWEPAFQYHYNRLYSYLSRRLSNWGYASSRLFVSPFSWIGPGPRASTFDDARPPAYVATQLTAFRKWGMGGEFANYAHGGLGSFDYTPYVNAMKAASTPAVVDAEPPSLLVNPARAVSAAPVASLALDGTATDNLAIRFVRWQNDRGGSGTAQLTWEVISGDYRSGYKWRSRWRAPAIPLRPGVNQITVTVEDIKGLATAQVIRVANGTNLLAGAEAPGRASPRSRPGRRKRVLTVGKISYRAAYQLTRARRGIRIKLARVGTGLKAKVSRDGRVKVRRRGGYYVLTLKLPRMGSYKLTLTPRGGPSRSKTIVIRVV